MAKLTALTVKRMTTPGRYGDGGGLWLQVRGPTQRSWLFRYMQAGKAREMGLGPVELVTLAEAREAAHACRRLLLQGVDPIERRRQERAAASGASLLTFRDVAERYIRAHEPSWRNEKHRAQWRTTLETYVFPTFGDTPVALVETGDVTGVLEALWSSKPETASRVRGRIEAILDYATAHAWRSGANPARWRGHLQKLLPARSKIARVEHYPAMPFGELPAFLVEVGAHTAISARALEFTILAAARSGETLGATWAEIDMDAAVWTIPAARMKAAREHRVPLSPQALAVLAKVHPMRDQRWGDLVFPGQKRGQPLSNMSMTMLMRRLKRAELTVHGFRSTFRDWAAETTNTPREVAEAALAHAVGDKVEAAYRRGDLFAKRRKLMDDWGAWCVGASSSPS